MATEAIDLTHQPARVTGRDVLAAVADLGSEMAERDDELREALVRLARMYGSLRDAVPERISGRPPATDEELELSMQALVQSVDTLVGVDTVASERVATLSDTVERLAESITVLAGKIERLDRRLGDLEVRVAPEALVDQTGPMEFPASGEPGGGEPGAG